MTRRFAPLLSLLLATALPAAPPHPAPERAPDASLPATTTAVVPTRTISLSIGSGQLMRLPRAAASVFVASDKVADVQVKNPTTFYLFAKSAGMTSLYALDHAGTVIWSADVRVGANIADVSGMLRQAMPEADIRVTPMSGMLLLTGTVLKPADAEEAQRLVDLFTAASIPILNHLQVATPQQVMLRVKIAEVNRTLVRNIGVNFLNQSNSNPAFIFGQGTPGTITPGLNGSSTMRTIQQLAGTTLGIAGHAFGADILGSLQLYENSGQVHTLAEPTLTALSGETASFLAGGEIPIPQSNGLGAVNVEFKQYGVSLAFSPIVMSDGRIELRVRPEVSQISDIGAVRANGFSIPGLTTRRAETTVELGSGQSFMIGGLLQNNNSNSVQKAPVLGNLPILGALFRSTGFQKQETELVIVVTPYLVKAIDANKIALPTDGYRVPSLAGRVLLDQTEGTPPAPPAPPRPVPTAAPVRP